jgi:hypothetical protein
MPDWLCENHLGDWFVISNAVRDLAFSTTLKDKISPLRVEMTVFTHSDA